jgi:hypothetical protein
MKAKLLTHRKERNADGHVMELKAWIVPVTECTPHGLKYSAVYIVNGVGQLDMITNAAKATIGTMQALKNHTPLQVWRSF